MRELIPGETFKRHEVHEMFGGRTRGGIGPSRQTPTVLFFTDPVKGRRHGYFDGWDDNGLFNYTGEGQVGDQRLVQGNKAILDHVKDGRMLKGFFASGSTVTFLNDFELVSHYWTEAPDTNGSLRQVVVFRLQPIQGGIPIDMPRIPVTPSTHDRSETVPIEEQHSDGPTAGPERRPYEFERRESGLVLRYAKHLTGAGHSVMRLRLVPAGESAPLYTDLWDETSGELVEAKGATTREHLRMAVGQLLDYGRFVPHSSLAVLVPARPRGDLRRYLVTQDIDAVYPEGGTWARN